MLLAPHEPKNRLYYDGSQHDAYALSASEQVIHFVYIAVVDLLHARRF